MKNGRTLLAAAVAALLVSGCGDGQPDETSARDKQAEDAARRANSLTFTDNAELGNIERRLRLTSQPGLIGFIVLLNEAGQPILYTSVKGKVTSSGKRLTPPAKTWPVDHGEWRGTSLGDAPSDEGSWGSSDPYVYFWTADGQYIQWNGRYLYSNSPIRLSVQPLVVNIGTPAQREPATPPGTPAPSATPAPDPLKQ